MRKINKILSLSFALIIGTASLSFAGEVVKYDDTNLDEILIKNGIEVDSKKVSERHQREIAKNPNPGISQNDQKEKPVLFPKTAVYSNVVDLSEHQKPEAINYDKFAKDIDGAILRSSITTFEENKKTKEKKYYLRKDFTVDRHYQNLNSRGVPIGFYHYSRATSENEALKEANFVLDYIKDKNVSLPIFMDIEDDLRQSKVDRKSVV